jgi:hypothetical protein
MRLDVPQVIQDVHGIDHHDLGCEGAMTVALA